MLKWYCHRSVVQIICRDLDHVFRFEVDLNERFATVLFLVLIHVVDLLYACLFDDLCATETWIVGCIQTTALGLADSYLDYGRLFGMKAEALVQLLALVIVASLTAEFIAGWYVFGSAVVASRDDPVLEIDDDCSDWCFHAVGSPSCDVCDLHEILVPSRSEKPNHVLLLPLQLFPQLFLAVVQQSYPHQLQTFLVLLIVKPLINAHKLMHSL